jgi:hypothetical protein
MSPFPSNPKTPQKPIGHLKRELLLDDRSAGPIGTCDRREQYFCRLCCIDRGRLDLHPGLGSCEAFDEALA